MLKIWGSKGSSNVQKVSWCCGELGLPFEQGDIAGAFGGLKSAGYLERNPNGLMPTIDDDGFVLWESNVIVRYLAAKHGAGTLYPTDPVARAQADRWMDWQQTTLVPQMGPLFRGHLKSPPDAIDPGVMALARDKAAAAWAILDAALAAQPYVGGDRLTMGDIALGSAVHRWFRLPVERPPMPNLEAWYARLSARPEYRKHVLGL